MVGLLAAVHSPHQDTAAWFTPFVDGDGIAAALLAPDANAPLLEAVWVCGGNQRVRTGHRLTTTGLSPALRALAQQGYSHPCSS